MAHMHKSLTILRSVRLIMYPYCKYYDGTEVVFSGIIKNEKGEETISEK